jgi:hypothetical protein
MTYYARVYSETAEGGEVLDVFNVAEDVLRARVLEPYETGGAITWNGRTVPVETISSIYIVRAESAIAQPQDPRAWWRQIRAEGEDLTNELITGAPGSRAAPTVGDATTSTTSTASSRDVRRVMVVHGRNDAARVAMFQFLRSLSLEPIVPTISDPPRASRPPSMHA